MTVFDWLFKRGSEEESAPGLSLPPRAVRRAWRPEGRSPEQLDAFLKVYEPRALPAELSGPPPRKDVWGAGALKDASFHDVLTDGNAHPCLVTTVVVGGEGTCIYRDEKGQPRSFPIEVPSQVRSFPLPLTAVELDGKQGVYEWLIWFPTTTTLPPAIFAEQAAHFISEGSPVKVIDVRRKAIIERLPIPGILEHPIESWESDEEKRGLVARLARLSGFEVSLLVDEDSARNPARVPPMEELRGRLASTGHRVSLISGIDGGYPGYVHAIAPELRCFCWRCALEEESRHFASMMARSSQRAEAEDYSVPRPLPGPEEMIRRLQAVPAGQLPPELRGLPAGSVSRAVVVHKEHKQDNEGIDYYATYAWLDGAGQLRSETVHHGWEGYFGQSSYVARLREGDVLHVVREAGEEHLHERALLTRMDAIPFRGRW